MTELEREMNYPEEFQRDVAIKLGIGEIREHIDRIIDEIKALDEQGIKVSEVIIHGRYAGYGSDISLVPGNVERVAEAFAMVTQQWGMEERDRGFTVGDTEIRGRR